MIRKIILLAALAVNLTSCDVFDTGDVEKVYDMDPQVELKPLVNQTTLDAGGTSVAVQLIGEHRSSDLEVTFTVNGDSAIEGTHFEVTTSSPITIEAGTSSASIDIDYIENSIPEGEEVEFSITLESTNADILPAENLKTSVTYIGN